MSRKPHVNPAVGWSLLVLGVAALAGCGGGGVIEEESPVGVSGVRGMVVVGPQCPVVQPGESCKDMPVEADVRATAAEPGSKSEGAGGLTGSTRSAADGSFELELPPGTYILQASSTVSPSGCKPVNVTVVAGELTEATLRCDSGVR